MRTGVGTLGLTTAATLFLAMAMGLSLGAGYYPPVILALFMAMFTLVPYKWFIDRVAARMLGPRPLVANDRLADELAVKRPAATEPSKKEKEHFDYVMFCQVLESDPSQHVVTVITEIVRRSGVIITAMRAEALADTTPLAPRVPPVASRASSSQQGSPRAHPRRTSEDEATREPSDAESHPGPPIQRMRTSRPGEIGGLKLAHKVKSAQRMIELEMSLHYPEDSHPREAMLKLADDIQAAVDAVHRLEFYVADDGDANGAAGANGDAGADKNGVEEQEHKSDAPMLPKQDARASGAWIPVDAVDVKKG